MAAAAYATNMPPACLLNAAGRQPKSDIHRTDYEGAGGPAVFQWLPGISLVVTDWTNKGGLGSPQRLLVTFVRTKVTRVRAGQARQQSTGV